MGMDSNQIAAAKLVALQDIAKSQAEIVRLLTIVADSVSTPVVTIDSGIIHTPKPRKPEKHPEKADAVL